MTLLFFSILSDKILIAIRVAGDEFKGKQPMIRRREIDGHKRRCYSYS